MASDVTSPVSDRLLIDGRRMPSWASWLTALGEWLRSSAPGDVVVGLSVPTDRYAAAFVMLGAHHIGATAAAPVTADQAMQLVRSWPLGAPIAFEFRGRRYEGALCEVTESHVVASTYAGVLSVPRANVLSVTLLPEGATPARRARPAKDALSVRSVLYPADPLYRIASSRVEALVIGQRAGMELDLSLPCQVGRVSGTLADVVRAKSLMRPKNPYRTEVLPYTADTLPPHLFVTPPVVTILGGAGPTLDWLGRAPSGPLVAIIDRNEARSGDAAAALLQRRAAVGSASARGQLPTAPSEVEMVAYRRRVG